MAMWLRGIQHNAEWRGRDDLAGYVLQLQDSEKVSYSFIKVSIICRKKKTKNKNVLM